MQARDGTLAALDYGNVNSIILDFRRGGNVAALLREGWSGQEEEFIWGVGARSSLVLPGLSLECDYRLSFELAAYVRPPDIARAKLVVFAAGEIVGTFLLDGQRTIIECKIKRTLIPPDGRLTVVLEHLDFGRPSDHGFADDRELAICVTEARAIPVAPDAVSGPRQSTPGRSEPRIACLVLAHRAPQILVESVAVLESAGIDVIVHVDKKADIASYRAAIDAPSKILHFLEERVDVYWGGYSMIEATLRLMDYGLFSGYDRLVLISDDTFPILLPNDLRKFLTVPINRITFNLVPEGHEFWHRYHDYWYFDHKATNPRGGFAERSLDSKFFDAMKNAEILQKRGKFPLKVHFGSQFWCLDATTCQRLIILQNNEHLSNSFRFSALPDELMFQSLLGTYFPDAPAVQGPVFADFSRPPGPLSYRSYADLPALVPPHIAFIRKIALDGSAFAQEMARRLLDGQRLIASEGIDKNEKK